MAEEYQEFIDDILRDGRHIIAGGMRLMIPADANCLDNLKIHITRELALLYFILVYLSIPSRDNRSRDCHAARD
jgi:hypothetical protein